MTTDQPEQNSIGKNVRVIVHSFFIVPFLIAVFAVLIFAMFKIVVGTPPNLQESLATIGRGGETERWQAAMDLTAMLQSAQDLDVGDEVVAQMIFEYERSASERKPFLRTYLALAMGLVGDSRFEAPLIAGLETADLANRLAAIKALGMAGESAAQAKLITLLEEDDLQVILEAIIALGRLGQPEVRPHLLPFLEHQEANLRWDAAVALAKLGDKSGWPIINQLLDRNYYTQFAEVDELEQDRAIAVAIEIARQKPDRLFKENLEILSRSDPNLRIADAALKALRFYGPDHQ